MNQNSTLILLTSGFPYGHMEPFLEDEVPYLAKEFEEVVIVSLTNDTSKTRPIPKNCRVIHFPLSSFDQSVKPYWKVLFSQSFWSELKSMCFHFRLWPNKGRVATAMKSLIYADQISAFIQRAFDENQLKQAVFYSYWLNDVAIALSLLKSQNLISKAVARLHGWDAYFERSDYGYLPYRQHMDQHLDHFYPISETARLYSLKKWAKNGEKFQTVRLGVALPDVSLSDEVQRRLLISASNVNDVKRVHLIVESLKQIKEPLHWVHFGDGPRFEDLMKAVEGTELEQHQIELKGRVSKDEVLNYYRSNRPGVFINVSSSEGIPVSIMEAMSFGIPAIATLVGGTGELISETNGIPLKADCSSEEVAKAISTLMQANEIDYLKVSMAARGTVLEEYSAEKNHRGFSKKLKALID